MNNAPNTTAANNRRNLVLATAGAAMAIFFSACQGGGSEQPASLEVATPVAVAVTEAAPTPEPVEMTAAVEVETTTSVVDVAPITDTPAPSPIPVETSTPDTTPTDNGGPAQFIPASSPDLPCTNYVEATELPLLACSTGPLVADFQSWVNYIDPDFVVDGYFGEDTYDAVIAMQAMYDLEQTGVIDDALMTWIDIDHSEGEQEPVDFPIDEWEPGVDEIDGYEEGC